MFFLQVNIGTNNNPQWKDVTTNDMVVFCDGYKGPSGLTGMSRIANEFEEIKENYAKKCYLINESNVYEINYNSQKIMEDDTNSLKTLSFRYVCATDYIDQIKVPQFNCWTPRMFYGTTPIHSSINPFFWTDEQNMNIGNVLELDNNLVEITQIESYGNLKKVFFRVLDENFIINKSRYICRNYGVHDSNTGLKIKILFHDRDVLGFPIPTLSSDVTDISMRRHTIKNTQMDAQSGTILFPLDASIDITHVAWIQDATLLQNVEYNSSVVYLQTLSLIDFQRGDYIVLRNDAQNEIMRIEEINTPTKSLTVQRDFSHKNFLSSDPSIKLFLNIPIYFQVFVFNEGLNPNILNAPVVIYFDLKYLNT